MLGQAPHTELLEVFVDGDSEHAPLESPEEDALLRWRLYRTVEVHEMLRREKVPNVLAMMEDVVIVWVVTGETHDIYLAIYLCALSF